MFFVLIVNLYISRVLLRSLGVSDYGIYVVVAGFVTLFGFFNATLSSTMQRYYNYAGTKNNNKGLQAVFSTGCIIHILIAGATLVIVESFGIWYFYHFLVIPTERFHAAFILFHASVASLILLILQSPFTGLVLSQEHMGYYSFVSIIDIILKLSIALSLAHLPYDSLSTYGLMLTSISLIDFLLYSIYAKSHWHFLHLSRHINRKLMKSLLSFTGWNLIGTFAFMLRGQGISLLLNNFFGPIVNAARGIASQVSNAIQNFSTNISVAFFPQLVNAIAEGNHNRAERLMFTETKICYTLLLVIAIPLCLEIDYVLKLWLGTNVPYQTNIFSILMLADTLVCTLNTPCTQVTMATGKIKKYEIAASTINLSLIPVCYIFLRIGYNAISSFIITIIFSIILQSICLIVTHRAFSYNSISYFRNVVIPCTVITILLPIIPFAIKYYLKPTFLRLIYVCIINICIAIPLVYFILLNKQEKQFCTIFFHNIKQRFIDKKTI